MTVRALWNGLFAGGGALALVLLLGRLAGLVRESIIGARFGLTAQGDVAAFLLSLPDLLLALLVSGGVSAALVPRIIQLPLADRLTTVRFAAIAIGGSFAVVGLLFAEAPEAFAAILAPGSLPEFETLGAMPVLLIACAIPVVAISGVSAAWLNANARFLPVGFGTLLFNATMIAVLLAWQMPDEPLLAVATGVFAGAAIRLASQLVLLPMGQIIARPVLTKDARHLAKDFASGVAGVMISLLPPVILRSVASIVGPGSLMAMLYSHKLIEVPVGVVFGAIGTVALSAISSVHGKPDGKRRAESLAHSNARRALLLGIVMAAGAGFFALPVVELVFGYGQMGQASVTLISRLFAIGALSLPFTAIAMIGTHYLYAIGKPGSAIVPSAAAACLTLILAVPVASLGELHLLMLVFVVVQACMALGIWYQTGLPFLSWHGTALFDIRLPLQVGIVVAPIALSASAASSLPWTSEISSLLWCGVGALAGAALSMGFTRETK